MSDQDWMRHDHTPPHAETPTYPEQTMWTLTKDGDFATAVIRTMPHRRELRLGITGMSGDLFRSDLERPGIDLEALAKQWRDELEAQGWSDAT